MQIARVPLCLFRACTLTRNTVVLSLHVSAVDPCRPPCLPLVLPYIAASSSSAPRFFLTSSCSSIFPSSYRSSSLGERGTRLARARTHTHICLCDSFLRKAYRDGTIISVDYAIITRPGGNGGGHLMPLARPRGGLPRARPRRVMRDLFSVVVFFFFALRHRERERESG